MGLFSGKKGVIMGVANEHSIAAGVANYLSAEGAQLAFSYIPDKEGKDRMRQRLARVTDPLNTGLMAPCDVTSDSDIAEFFAQVKSNLGAIDFVVHSVAFAPADDIKGPTLRASRQGFAVAMDISVYSLIAVARAAAGIMAPGGSLLTMTYYGGEKVVAGYNLMGVCKAALEATVRYLAFDLGEQGLRVNAVSAGPIKTLAAAGIGKFSQMLAMNSAVSPLGRNISKAEVAKTSGFLLSDMASGITGEIVHVDAGYHIMGNTGRAASAFCEAITRSGATPSAGGAQMEAHPS